MKISTLVGECVKLIPLELEHAAELYEASKHPEIWTYLPEKIHSLEDAEKSIRKLLAAKKLGTDYPFAVWDRISQKIVGTTRYLNIVLADKQLEIGGTWYIPEVWRTRLNTECKYLLLRHSFEILKMVRVQLVTDSRNHRSRQAIQRIGAMPEGVLRKHRILSDGYIRDTCVFSITEDEWPAVKNRLEGFLNKKEFHVK